MSLKIGIVGAGWYGCHIALSLASLGFQVKVFDRAASVLAEASGNNQFRLHLGFHYARHHGTRLQSRDGFQRFMERYGGLTMEVPENIYAVPLRTSLIDFQTYKMIMAASGIPFEEQSRPARQLKDVEGALRVDERVILLEKARGFFRERLNGVIELERPVTAIRGLEQGAQIDGERFDYVVDATWGHSGRLPIPVFFEPTLLLYYERLEPFPAITLVDGPLCSIYPTEDPQIVTLSSVPHTPLGRCASAEHARRVRDEVDGVEVARRRALMEDQVSVNVPGFRDAFRFAGVQLAIKTKPVGDFDDRSCAVHADGNVFSVMSGKIDTIFHATERILSMIEADRSLTGPAASASLFRNNILNIA